MRFFIFLFFPLTGLFNYSSAQGPCSGAGGTAQTGIAVCGTLVFPQANVPSCTGPNLPPSGCSDPVTSSNSVWYKFHCYQSGTLGFLISPNAPSDDYDWELMDYTGHPPGDVYLINLMVSLNLSAITGPTGCTLAGSGNVHCAGGAAGSQFNQMPILQAGNDYLLMVTNWSNSGLGYNLIFSGGTAVLTNNLPPAITTVGIVGCNSSLVHVNFSKDVLCSSVTSTGSEFTISGGANVITGISSDCSNGAYTVTGLTINLQNPLLPGNYQLTINNGSDGNTFLDVCLDTLQPGTVINFTVPSNPPVSITGVNYSGCAPTVLDIPLSKPVWCSSVTSSGSEFSILPGNLVISGVQSTCNGGAMYTDTLHLLLQNQLPAGNYQLVVNNGTDGNTLVDTCNNYITPGNTTAFTISATTTPPVIQSIGFDPCHPDKLIINFDKPVACSSLTAGGDEFSITPGSWPIASITSNCGPANYTSQVIFSLSGSLTAGNFNVNINTGSDGNTLSDTCFSFITPGYSKQFTATQAPLPVFDSLQFDKCSPTFLKAFYSQPILCSSVSADGSDFVITGPQMVNITGATTDITCVQGYTNWVALQLAQPITVFTGAYMVHSRIGSDGNGIIDTCNAIQSANDLALFTVLGKPSTAFTSVVKWGCIKDTIVLTHPGGNGINSWTWIFSDGSTASGQTVTHNFPVSTMAADIKLVVSNGFCIDSLTQTVTLGNAFKAGFTNLPKDTTCLGNPVNFTDTSSGNITQYLWIFGDGTQFIGQAPPPHIYSASLNYTIKLIVTESHGCRDTTVHQLVISTFPAFDFHGLAAQYCTGQTVVLSRSPYPDFLSYSWDNGDGKVFQNNINVEFSYALEGLYTIALTGIHKYCGSVVKTKTVPVFAIPMVNLGRDTVLCPDMSMPIGVAQTGNYTYLWNTGQSSSIIYTKPFTWKYGLVADNHGC